MNDMLHKLWPGYNLSLVLLALFLASWSLHAWTGWRKLETEH
jgi:hypothetical protein